MTSWSSEKISFGSQGGEKLHRLGRVNYLVARDFVRLQVKVVFRGNLGSQNDIVPTGATKPLPTVSMKNAKRNLSMTKTYLELLKKMHI